MYMQRIYFLRGMVYYISYEADNCHKEYLRKKQRNHERFRCDKSTLYVG